MTDFDSEWVTLPLNRNQWAQALTAVLEALKTGGVEQLELMHGWSTSTFGQTPEFAALEWQTEVVTLTELPTLLRERERLGFFLGRDDLFLMLPDGTEIKCCHERDLHLRTHDGAFAFRLGQLLTARNIPLMRRAAKLNP